MPHLVRRWIVVVAIFLAFSPKTLHAQTPPNTGLLRQVWFNIPGEALDGLTTDPRFPNNPDQTNYVTDFFESPTDIAEQYGQRMFGYIVPPVTGNYEFWIATDDQGVLFLSTDANPANKQAIARISGWTASRNWVEGEAHSAPVRLEAGRSYYIEAQQKEGGGGDNLAVRWQLPDSTMEEPIPASRLRPWGIVFTAPVITQHPDPATAVEGGSATFAVKFSNADPLYFQWQKDNVNIPGANSPEYTRLNVAMADHNANFRCFLSNSLGTVYSNPAKLTVTPDVTPPTLASVMNASDRTIALTFSEAVQVSSATTAGNYQINGGLAISTAVAGADAKTIVLTASAAFAYGTTYTLTVTGVKDQAVAQNTIAPGSQISFLAAEYVPADIGGATGNTTYVTDGYNVTATGRDIAGSSDQFHFDYQARTGNFDVKVRVANLSAVDMWTKAGLMARETLAANARFAGVFTTPSLAGIFSLNRATANGQVAQAGFAPATYPNAWLRLARSGTSFASYASVDGQNWLSLGSVSISGMPSTLFLGTALASHHPTQTATAQFREIGTTVGGSMVASLPVKGEPLAASTRRTGLVISEIMYHPAAREDGRNLEYFEIFNTDPIAEKMGGYRVLGAIDYTFPAGTVLPSGGFLVVAKDPAAVRAVYGIDNVVGPYTGNMSNDSDVIEIRNHSGAMILQAHFSDKIGWPLGADGAGHSLALARPSFGEAYREAWAASALIGGSPGRMEPIRTDIYENLVINEILAHTDDPQKDYIEIYNHSGAPVNLAGCFLADNRSLTNRFVFPDPTMLPARGFLAIDQDALGFALSAGGETIYLVASNDVRVIDAVRFEGQANGVSFGRSPDGSATLRALQSVTQGGANSAPVIGNVVINEIMYHPISENDDDEYVELFNRGTTDVDLAGWAFTDAITFTFPPGTVIPGGGYMVVARNAANLASKYSQLASTNMVGDYDGSLSNSGERLALSRPDEIQTTNEFGVVVSETIYIVEAEVEYREGGRWGKWADGGGSSLELIDAHADATQPASWADSNEEAKAPWTTIEATGVLDNGNMSNPDQFQMHLQGGGECLVDDVEVRRTTAGAANLITNPGFESDLTGWVKQGAFSPSFVESGSGISGTKALRVISPVRGDTGANRIRFNMGAGLASGNTATLRAKVRWLKGHPEFLLRLRGNWLEAFGKMTLPENLGTPGQPNSRRQLNVGPSIYEVAHSPILPAISQAVVVTARVFDPDGIGTPQLRYRIDPAATISTVNMNDSGTAGDAVANDGIWSGIIPGQTSGKLAAFHVQAADGAAPAVTTRFPAEAPTRECLVRWGETQTPGTFATYRIWMTEATLNTWRTREVLNNAPLDVTFVYGNSRVSYNVGGLYSGSPFHAGFDSPVGGICDYVLNFREDDLFLGVTDFILASVGNLDNDDSAQREQAAFWIARELSVPYNHRRYMHLYVNGSKRGKIYEDAQQPSGDFLDGWFPEDPNGELMKIEDWFEFSDSVGMLGNVDATLGMFTTTGGALKTARYRWTWRPRAIQNSANDFTDLFELVRAANDNTPAYTTRLDNVVDVEEWMRIICLEHMVGNWDSYGYGRGKNMYAYRPANGKWNLMAWDIDFVLGSGSDGPTTDMFAGVNDGAVSKMLNTPQFRRAYYRAMLDAVNGPLVPENIASVLDARSNALQANGVTVPSTSPIKTYVAQRRAQLQGLLSPLAVSFAITSNNGNNFSTNKNFIRITGRAPVAVKTIKVNGAPYPATWTTVTEWAISVPLTAASNVLDFSGYDLRGNLVAGSTDSITIAYTGALTSPKGSVVINEIMYNSFAPDASYIELYNTSTTAGFDLSGYQLDGAGFTFPNGSVIGPTNFMLIAKSIAAFTIAYGSGIPIVGEFTGSLDNGGERLKLVKPGATPELDEEIDVVRYDDDPPWRVEADGTGPSLQLIDATKDNSRAGNWTVMTNSGVAKFTPGATNNVRAVLSEFPTLWINEVLPNNTSGITDGVGEAEPWIEIYNLGPATYDLNEFYLTDNYSDLLKWRFPAGTSLTPGQFLIVWADNEQGESLAGAPHANFRLHPTTGSVALVRMQGSNPAVVDYVNYTITTANRSFGSYPDGQNQDRQLFHFPSPRLANDNTTVVVPVTINEWMAGNTRAFADPADRQFEDWFELYNSSGEAVDLSGYYLTDTLTNSTKFRIPPGYVVPANGYLLVWADEEMSQNVATNLDLHANFKLSGSGEEIGLFGADGTKIDSITFGAQTDDVSQGRFPDGGAAPFYLMPQSTARGANTIPSGNKPPTLTGVADAIIPEEAAYAFQAVGADPDAGQTLTYSLIGGPTGAAINPATGVFTWTPTENDGPGNFTMTARVTDNGSPALSRSVVFTLTVMEANRAPVLGSLTDVEIPEAALYGFTVPVHDPDAPAQPIQFFLDEGPEGASVNSSSGRFGWAPSEAQGPGVYPVTIRVVDGATPALSDNKRFFITVRDVNAPPIMNEIADAFVVEGDSLTINPVVRDDDLPAQAWTFSMQGLPSAQIDPATGRFTWTPATAEIPSTNVVTIRATDSGSPSMFAERTFTIIAAKSNHLPVFNPLPDQTTAEEAAFSLQLNATDEDAGQTLTYALEGAAPNGLALSAAGLLTWTPAEEQGPSTNRINFKVTDDGTPPRSIAAFVNIIVTEANRAPTIASVSEQSATVGEIFAITLTATDADRPNNALTYSLEPGSPPGANIEPATGRLTWTPETQHANTTQNISVRVTDNGTPALNDVKVVAVRVKPPVGWKFVSVTGAASSSRLYVYLEAPGNVIIDDLQLVAGPTAATGPNLLANGNFETALAGSWTVSANHATSYLTNVAKSGNSGLNLIATTGGTTQGSSIWQDISPGLTQGAEYTISYWIVPNTNNINLNVRLSGNGIVARTSVLAVNLAPALTGVSNATIPEGVEHRFQAIGSDPDFGQSLAYSLVGAPNGAVINPTTGVFTFTPAENQGPGSFTMTVRVTDNGSPAMSQSAPLTLTVTEVNTAPILAVVPEQNARVGEPFALTLTATDADRPNNVLTYSLDAGAPQSASIDPASGRLTWTPAAADADTTRNISVRVTDNGTPVASDTKVVAVRVSEVQPPPTINLSPSITSSGEIQMQWDARAGLQYRIYFRTDVAEGAWQSLTELTATGATATFRAPLNAAETRFFKVQALP